MDPQVNSSNIVSILFVSSHFRRCVNDIFALLNCHALEDATEVCPETSVTTNLRCVTTQKNEDLLYSVHCKCDSDSIFYSPHNRPRRPVRGVEVYLYSFFNLGVRWVWVVNSTPRPLYPQERPGTHCRGGCVGPRSFWTGAENLTPSVIRSPVRPARSELLYLLSYPGPHSDSSVDKNIREWNSKDTDSF